MIAARNTFPAGLALDSHKRAECSVRIVDLPKPARVVLVLDQGSGHAADAVVTAGDTVALGALIGRAATPYAANVHASIAGTVVAVGLGETAHASGTGLCVTIQRSADPVAAAPLAPPPDWTCLDPVDLTSALHAAGIAGLGGAAFPTATKLAAARTRDVHTLIVNGAECEPWISCDDALMQTNADEVLLGALVLRRACGATSCIVAIEDDKPQAIAALTGAIARQRDTSISLQVLPAIYPRGAERQLISAVTGVEVPSGGRPVDAGIVCQNVATAFACAHWALTGEPLVTRVVTITGSGVARPCNVRAPLGTPLADLVAAAGGYSGTPLRLIAGGNMTGRALPSDELGLTKAMNCVLVATHADLAPRLEAVEVQCIRCGDCADVCPAGLLPQQLHRAAIADQHDALRQLGVLDCIDCGLCDYVCPSQIPLALRFRAARSRLGAADAAAAKAAAARERHEQHERRLREAAAAEQRAFEDVRKQARHTEDALDHAVTGRDAAGRDGTT